MRAGACARGAARHVGLLGQLLVRRVGGGARHLQGLSFSFRVGSVVEDRAARKLIDAGNLRYEAGEIEKAIDIWNSVLERYPRSRVRFQAHLKLGEHFLNKQRAFDRARSYFESAASADNPDAEQRAEATLMSGICFYEGRHYGKCFKIMRGVIIHDN